MSLRIFTLNNSNVIFNTERFRLELKKLRDKNKIPFLQLEQQLADKLGVSTDTVHGWHYGKNGPIDINIVQHLAQILEIDNFTLLLKNINGEHCMQQLTDRQKNAVKRIYDICIWFLDQFYLTDGFNDYWYKFKDAGANNPEFEINNLVDSYMYKIFLVIKQEYFDLHDCDIYDELYEFVNNNLYDIYEGKVSYAYRFEAIPDGNPTTSEDYSQAMNRLNSIIEKYI